MITNKQRDGYHFYSLVVLSLVLAAFVYGEVEMVRIGFKRCTKCGEMKGLGEFGKGNDKFGLRYWCKGCENTQAHQYKQDHKEETKQYYQDYKEEAIERQYKCRKKNEERNLKYGIIITEKRCTKCGKIKSVDKFGPRLSNPDGLRYWCNDCVKKYNHQYQQDHKEEIKKHREEHKEEIREWQREYKRKRRQTDITARLNSNTSRAIRHALKAKGGSKQGKRTKDILAALGYTIQDLMTHIESLWEPGMSWDNYGFGKGKWVIDHKKPIKLFHFISVDDPDFKACWALSNLQPLWWEENMKKGAEYSADSEE